MKAVADVQMQRKVCILDIDMQGVRSIKQTDLSPVYIFVKPPSIDVLVCHLSAVLYTVHNRIHVNGLLKCPCYFKSKQVIIDCANRSFNHFNFIPHYVFHRNI